MSNYSRTSEQREREKLVLRAIALFLKDHPSAEGGPVKLGLIQKAVVDVCALDQVNVPAWIFSKVNIGRVLKSCGFAQRRFPEFRSYVLESQHARKSIEDIEGEEKSLECARLDPVEFVGDLTKLRLQCVAELGLSSDSYSQTDQLRLWNRVLERIDLLEPRHRNFVRPIIEKGIRSFETGANEAHVARAI